MLWKLALVLLMVLIYLAVAFLPWWLSLGLGIVFIFSIPAIVGWMIKQFFIGLFDQKSRVLRGAGVAVHSIAPASKPEKKPSEARDADGDEDDNGKPDGEPEEHHDYFTLDVTLTPAPAAKCTFRNYDPFEIVPVPPDAKPGVRLEDGSDDSVGYVEDWELFVNGAWLASDALDKLDAQEEEEGGAQRLKLLLAVKPGPARVRLRYYFEVFGDIALPGR